MRFFNTTIIMDQNKLSTIKEKLDKFKNKSNINYIFFTVLFINIIISLLTLILNSYLNTKPVNIIELLGGTIGILIAIFLLFTNDICSKEESLGWIALLFIISSIGMNFISLFPLFREGEIEWKYGMYINIANSVIVILDTIFVVSISIV